MINLKEHEAAIEQQDAAVTDVMNQLQVVQERLISLQQSQQRMLANQDKQVADTITESLSDAQQREQELLEEKTHLLAQLQELDAAVHTQSAVNDESRHEIMALAQSGEDVSDALAICNTRDGEIAQQRQRIQNLISKLNGNTEHIIFETPKLVPSEKGQFVERGVVMMKVADIPDPPDIHGAEDFRKVPLEQMQSTMSMLQEMIPLINSGVGNKRDYWEQHDDRLGITNPGESFANVYSIFYGSEPIRIENDGGQMHIINGRHRLWVAKQLGMTEVPVSLTERE